jgi:hypothetical protein
MLLGLLLAMVAAASASAAYDPADPAQRAAYDHALAVGQEAYVYGVPLLDSDALFRTGTSVNVSNGRGAGPVNQFNHFTRLADADDRTVVAPNRDTLYSAAALVLGRQPQVIHTVKGTKRFHAISLLDPYQEDFANIGSPEGAYADGDYLVTGPGWRGTVPRGLTRIRAPYDRVWVLGRTYTADQADLAATRKVMDGYKITPLHRWSGRHPYAYTPPRPAVRDLVKDTFGVPGSQPGEDPLTFFDALNAQLAEFVPPRRDAPVLGRIAELGIGPGKPSVSRNPRLSDAQRAGLAAAVAGGPALVQGGLVKRFLAAFDAHNGWLVQKTGRYGTDYMLRAMVDKIGVGASTPNVSVYPVALTDRDKGQLNGAKRYVAHFAARDATPPVRFFWSMTLYDTKGFFVVNPIDRWLVNDRTGLARNADGSIDVYLQPDAPASAAQRRNWLPTPGPGAAVPTFRIILRLYGLSTSAIAGVLGATGWQPPTIRACLADGRTSDGIACAG